MWLRNHRNALFLNLFAGVLLVLSGCASSLPQKILRHDARGEYIEALALLEKEGVGQIIRPDPKPEAIKARLLFTRSIWRRYGSEAMDLANNGQIRSAFAKVNEGLALCSWSSKLKKFKSELFERIVRIDNLVSKWQHASPDRFDLGDAREFLRDLNLVENDYVDTEMLIALHDRAISSIVTKWERRINSVPNPITKENSEQFWNDLGSANFESLRSDDCVAAMASLSEDSLIHVKQTISNIQEPLMRGATCLGKTKLLMAKPQARPLEKASKNWLKLWFATELPKIARHEHISFETITAYETVLKNISPEDLPGLRHEIGLLHLEAAEKRAGSGASAALALLHVVRAKQHHKDIERAQTKKIQQAAMASIIAGERLEASMAIDSDPEINPQLYDLVRTAFMVAIRGRTKGYFTWTFLPPGKRGSSELLAIDFIDFQIPSYGDLNTVVSKYYSHSESVRNPQKSYLKSMLSSAKLQLDWAENSYNSAVSSHNIYPTDYSLINVNNAYNNYVNKLNIYNSLVSQYNATPATIERAVYMPYSFREGLVKYGWEIKARFKIGDHTGKASGRSMESDFVRIGTRYNDTNSSRRRDDELAFDVSFERAVSHLFNVVNTICDQIQPSIANAVSLKYAAGISENESNTIKWLFHPWGFDYETGQKIGIPQWALDSAKTINLPDVTPAPPAIALPSLPKRPNLPMSTKGAAKWYRGLVGEIIAERQKGSHTLSTGAIVSPDGLVLTCAHGLSGEKLKVRFRNCPWAGSYYADIIFVNEIADVAILKAQGLKTARWIEIRFGATPEKGEEIITIGNPSLPWGTTSIEAISKGIVSNPKSEFHGVPSLIADITVASGSSGGPIISLVDGKLIGVVLAVADAGLAKEPGKRSASGTICLAAPSTLLSKWLGIYSNKK